jgi:hypothetical protein
VIQAWPNADTAMAPATSAEYTAAAEIICGTAGPESRIVPYIVGKSPLLPSSASLGTTRCPKPTRKIEPITLLSCESQRFVSWVKCWQGSTLPSPNLHLICKFSEQDLWYFRLKGASASALREKLFNSIAHLYARWELPWLYVYAMESHHGIHVHVLLWAPEGRRFRNALANLLVNWFQMPRKPGVTSWGLTRERNSGALVYFTPISVKRVFRRTGQRGLAGACDYVAKDIDHNAFAPIISKRLGRLIGASTKIREMRRASGLARPRTAKMPRLKMGGAAP